VSSWTDGSSGFDDLLDSRGAGTKIVAEENRLVAFTTEEIWQIIPTGGPFVFTHGAIDRKIGCPYPATVADTPWGIVFMGNDFNMYILPKGGGVAQTIGNDVYQELRTNLDQPSRAWGLYNTQTQNYELHYAVRGGGGYPTKALFLDSRSLKWMPQSYTHSLTYGWMGSVGTTSAGTTWQNLLTAGLTWGQVTQTWGQLAGSTIPQLAALYGASGGTFYYGSSAATNDANLDGQGKAVVCRWRSHAIGGDDPTRSKTLTEIRLDYTGDSTSSLSVTCSYDGGTTWDRGQAQSLPASSNQTQTTFFPYCNARYPMFELQLSQGRARFARMHGQYRPQGR
jgi:hypothetical protein